MDAKPIEVNQLIYSRVEAKYSPKGKTGFQTVYQHGLSPDVIDSIEERIRCFDTSAYNAKRIQFFPLDNKKFFISHTIPIKTHTEIIDRSGRPGAFLSHCIVLNVDEFEQFLQNDPFLLIDNFTFVKNADEMLRQICDKDSLLRQRTLSFPEAPQQKYRHPISNAISIALYFMTSAEHAPVFVCIDDPHNTEMIRLLFRILPIDLRVQIPFDTFINRCSIEPTWYKLVCANRDSLIDYPNYIDAESLFNKRYDTYEMTSIYQGWLSYINQPEELKQKQMRYFLLQMESIQHMDTELRLMGKLNLSYLSRSSLDDIASIRHKFIERALWQRLTEIFNSKLTNLIIHYVLKNASRAQLITISVAPSTTEIDVEKALSKCVDDNYSVLHQDDWDQIKTFARAETNHYLLFLSATFGDKLDKRAHDESLNGLEKEQFQRLLKTRFRNPITPASFVQKTYLSLLLRKSRIDSMTDEEIISLIARLVKVGSTDPLVKFITRIEQFDLESIIKLDKVLRRQKNLPAKVSQAIDDCKLRLQIKPPRRRFWIFNQ